jgi:predicted GNAT family N-acyltransferase
MSGSDDIDIREANINEIIDLRWRILRGGLPRTTAIFPLDEDPTTHHFGAFVKATGENVGCASFSRREWEGKSAWQLRGMAVSDELRGQGIGTRMLELAESVLRGENFSNQLWCNARTPATPFYEKLGWKRVGEEFHIETAGPHYKMIKTLRENG